MGRCVPVGKPQAPPYLCRVVLADQTAARANHDLCRRTNFPPGGHPGSASKAAGLAALRTITTTLGGQSATFLPRPGEAVDGRRRPRARTGWPGPYGPVRRLHCPGVAGASKPACQNPMHLYGVCHASASPVRANRPGKTPCACMASACTGGPVKTPCTRSEERRVGKECG